MIYFDNSATTKVKKEVKDEMLKVMDEYFANLDANYTISLKFSKYLEEKKKILKDRLGLNPNEFVFTTGGGEANNIALTSVIRKYKKGHFLISSIEHASVEICAKELSQEGYELEYIPVDGYGNIDLEYLKNAIREDTILVSIIGVNNELGTVQNMKEIGEIIKNKNKNTYLHIDFVQGLNHIDIDFSKIKVDLLSISSHKIGGPKGIGALYISKNVKYKEQIYGENNSNGLIHRTFPNELVCGFLKAISLYKKEDIEKIKKIKDYYLFRLSEIKNVDINTPINSSPSIVNISFKGVRAEVLLNYLSTNDIYVSTGSACSGNKGDSKILKAINLNQESINGSIRVSFSCENTFEEIDMFFDILTPFLEMARSIK